MPTHAHILAMLDTIHQIIHEVHVNPQYDRDDVDDFLAIIDDELTSLTALAKAMVKLTSLPR